MNELWAQMGFISCCNHYIPRKDQREYMLSMKFESHNWWRKRNNWEFGKSIKELRHLDCWKFCKVIVVNTTKQQYSLRDYAAQRDAFHLTQKPGWNFQNNFNCKASSIWNFRFGRLNEKRPKEQKLPEVVSGYQIQFVSKLHPVWTINGIVKKCPISPTIKLFLREYLKFEKISHCRFPPIFYITVDEIPRSIFLQCKPES